MTIDALKELEEGKNWENLKSAVAYAFAELTEGTITHIDKANPEGFYLLDKEDHLNYIKFSQVTLDFYLRALQARYSASFVANGGTRFCKILDEESGIEYTASYSGGDPAKGELLSFIKCALKAKRAA